MAGTKDGRIRQFCRLQGLTPEEYQANIESGLKWCFHCKQWRPRGSFAMDRSRADGLRAKCSSPGCSRKVEKKKHERLDFFKGKKHTKTAREKMSKARKGNNNRAGATHTVETRMAISAITKARTQRGAEHYAWKGGVSVLNNGERATPEYREWRLAVFKRDGFACVACDDCRGGNLNAHHLEGFANNPAKRFEVENGVTLCEACHNSFHKCFGYNDNTKSQFEQWIFTNKNNSLCY